MLSFTCYCFHTVATICLRNSYINDVHNQVILFSLISQKKLSSILIKTYMLDYAALSVFSLTCTILII